MATLKHSSSNPQPNKPNKLKISPEQRIKMLDLLKNPKFFIERFFWIVDKNQKKVPFLFNDPQRKYFENRTHADIIVKSRKEGFSSLIEAINLHACMFFENERAVTMAQNQDELKVHLDRVEYFIETMGTRDRKFKITIDDHNQREIDFPLTNSKYWLGTAGARTFGRSRDITRLHCTEVAHYEDQSVLTGVLNACTPDAWKALETTTNGMELVYDLWIEAQDPLKNSPWKDHFFAWFEDPSNVIDVSESYVIPMRWLEMAKAYKLKKVQIAWYDKKYSEQTDKSLMPQEFPSNWQEAFISSGRHVFNVELLNNMKKRCVDPLWIGRIEDDGHTVEWVDDPNSNWNVWKHRREDKRYIIVGDIGEGVPNGTPSVATVFDRASWEVCAEWRGRIDPTKIGELMVTAGYYFNDAVLIPENNNFGHVSIQRIKELKYPHLFRTDEIWPSGTRVQDGFPTDERSKERCVSALRNAIENQTYYENSKGAIEEMIDAVRDDSGKIVSKRNQNKKSLEITHHLDRMITRGIGLFALKFLGLDETYRESRLNHSPLTVQTITRNGYEGYDNYIERERGQGSRRRRRIY